MKKKIPEYQATKIRPLIQLAARMVQKNPSIADNMDYLWASLVASVPALADKSICGGCDRSMKITLYEAGLCDALLVYAMAKEVNSRLRAGMEFTEANNVYLPGLDIRDVIKKRQTKCDYLGLIKQSEKMSGKGNWVLTTWTWRALKGEPFPKKVKYWEGKILGRSTEMTTLSGIFSAYERTVQIMLAKGITPKSDYRLDFANYDPKSWIEFGGLKNIKNEKECAQQTSLL